LQIKSLEAVAAAANVTQFLDRDTSPEFASNVAGQAFADFLADPSSIDGILDEASEIAGDVGDQVVLNAALIAAAQAVEHYEITRYGTLTSWAKLLGHTEVSKMLFANLKEEKATDKKLNDIAKRKINKKALARQPKPLTVEEKLEEAMIGIPVIG